MGSAHIDTRHHCCTAIPAFFSLTSQTPKCSQLFPSTRASGKFVSSSVWREPSPHTIYPGDRLLNPSRFHSSTDISPPPLTPQWVIRTSADLRYLSRIFSDSLGFHPKQQHAALSATFHTIYLIAVTGWGHGCHSSYMFHSEYATGDCTSRIGQYFFSPCLAKKETLQWPCIWFTWPDVQLVTSVPLQGWMYVQSYLMSTYSKLCPHNCVCFVADLAIGHITTGICKTTRYLFILQTDKKNDWFQFPAIWLFSSSSPFRCQKKNTEFNYLIDYWFYQ